MTDVKFALNPKYSCWISASAGSGKTKILTDRFISLLLNGVNPLKILCITYTKAAALEMKTRILSELKAISLLSDNKLKEKFDYFQIDHTEEKIVLARSLYQQLLNIQHKLKIQTIHAFCNYLLKQYAVEAEIDYNFKIIDDQERKNIIEEARNLILGQVKNLKSIDSLVEDYNLEKFDILLHELLFSYENIINLIESYNGLENYLSYVQQELNIIYNKQELDNNFLEDLFLVNKEIIEELNSILNHKLASKTDIEKANKIYNALLKNDINEYVRSYLTLDNEKIKSICTVKVSSSIKIENLLSEQERCYEYLHNKFNIEIFEKTKVVLQIVDLINHQYSEKKGKDNLDFGDVLKFTRNLLENKEFAIWILYKLDHGIDHFLIDEAQDTSLIQWQIIDLLTEEIFSGNNDEYCPKTLFVVGDEKQSIYSFQGANPNIFNYKKLFIQKQLEITEQNFTQIRLTKSYRTCNEILQFVDKVFEDNSIIQHIALDYSKHISARENQEGKVKVINVVDNEEEKIALQIKDWLDSEKFLENKNRRISPGDIMILLKKRGVFFNNLINALNKHGIPNSGHDKIIINSDIIINEMLLLAKFAILPYNELNLAALLKTPLFNLTDNDLEQFCFNRKENLFNIIVNQTDLKITETIYKVLSYRNLDIYDFYHKIFNEMNFYNIITNTYGNEAEYVINCFIEIVLKFVKNNKQNSLEHFIDYFNNNESVLLKDCESGNVVKIMTVHGSKGLQAPIVILANTTDYINNSNQLLWNNAENSLVLLRPKKKKRSSYVNKIIDEENNNILGEYYRLLYVALTRAEDEIYIYGSNSKEGQLNWFNACNNIAVVN